MEKVVVETEVKSEALSHWKEKSASERLGAALRVQSEALRALSGFFHSKGVMQLLPVVVSPITDPLNHSVFDARISYDGIPLELTKSMILHKQLALAFDSREAVYFMSPNVRLEPLEKGASGRHLIEFTQADFEFKRKRAGDVKRFTEEMLLHVVKSVKRDCWREFGLLDREPPLPTTPFKEFDSRALEEEFGSEWESVFSHALKEPAWVTDFEREFYDKEDSQREGHYLNYDLIYPHGFGEGLSGGEREHDYERIVERMKRNGMDASDSGPYAHYLALAREGLIPPSAGAGLGIERLTRFLCGFERIEEAALFAKVPGKPIVF